MTTPRILVVAGFAASLAAVAPMAVAQPAPGASSPAVTHVQTAQDLAAVCDPAWGGVPRLEAIAYCQGFLTGFGQYHALLHPAGGRLRPLFCVPTPGPTIAESGIAFAGWVRADPGRGNEAALDALVRWAQASFPCAAGPRAGAAPRSPR